MLSIGDFSKLSRVSVKTLRFYDEIGLFKALEVDRFTGYRHYSASQLPRLNRILALKDLGFSLEQIAHVLHDEPSLEQLRGMLRLRQAEIQQKMAQEQEQLARVEARLRQIEMEHTMSDYDVIVKNVEPQLVASVRGILSSYQDIGRLFGELYGLIEQVQCRRSSLTVLMQSQAAFIGGTNHERFHAKNNNKGRSQETVQTSVQSCGKRGSDCPGSRYAVSYGRWGREPKYSAGIQRCDRSVVRCCLYPEISHQKGAGHQLSGNGSRRAVVDTGYANV